jgi:hypothetical protein
MRRYGIAISEIVMDPRRTIAVLLVLLFFGLTFNAYACLVPLFGSAHAGMQSGCSEPQQQPVRQFCDAFKTLGVQASLELHPAFDCQVLCPEETASLSLLFSLTTGASRAYTHPADGPPQDLLVKTTVLRL